MSSYRQDLKEELAYLDKTVLCLKRELEKEVERLTVRKDNLLETRKKMWEDTVHFSNDFERLTEISQYLSEVANQTSSYGNTHKRIENYKRVLNLPYFGRFDFVEEGWDEKEKIYVGLHNVIDSQTNDIVVYDWRAPISSMFYQYELGDAAYQAPGGVITGEVLLKRQYKIRQGRLKYFFDCNIKIDDEVLQEVLSHNTSVKMKSVVETIQKEQDIIIRDTDNELLIVQGVAGSGKTSIALHRIAFLLYHGMNANLMSNNILIISPNTIFSKYTSSVLPELGEENVEQITFDDLIVKVLEGRLRTESRNKRLEALIGAQDDRASALRKSSIAFKESKVFEIILNRLIRYYAHHFIVFEDVYYDGITLETKQQLKAHFLNDKIGMPIAKRLKRLESRILDKIHLLQKKRIKKIEHLVQKMDGHGLEIQSFSRLLSIKESKVLLKRIKGFTEIHYLHVYRVLFTVDGLFFKLAQGLELPRDIEQIIAMTRNNLEKDYAPYEDCTALLFLKLKLEGSNMFSAIKQVVIDEAQDYTSMHYEVFNLLFKDVRYTVLGDIYQSIDRSVNASLYDRVVEIFGKRKAVKLSLNKSYRSSYEISAFAQKILDVRQDYICFERHEAEPVVVCRDSVKSMEQGIIQDVGECVEKGYESVAVICKTAAESEKCYHRFKDFVNLKLVISNDAEFEKGVVVMPAYMAKGLEFDAVFVYNVSADNYWNDFDRKLLYIACTRALHRLVIYYTGEKSALIP